MKTKIYPSRNLMTCLLILCVSGISAQHNKENKKKPQEKSTNKILVPTCLLPAVSELTIDLTTHVMEETRGNFEISEFKITNIKSTAGSTLPQKVDMIHKDHFCALRDSASSIIAKNPTCNNAVRALRIKLGLNATKDKIVLIYQPLALCNPTIAGTSATFQVLEGGNPKYYIHTSTGFSTTNTITCATYTQNVLIKHTSSVSTTSFQAGNDVESVVYSFQEIGQLIEDNPNDKVTIWNAIGKKAIVNSSDSSYYHSVLLGPEQLLGPKSKSIYGPFPSKYANLAHLCPPSCGELIFKIKP